MKIAFGSLEYRKMMSEIMTGKKFSEEHKENIRKSRIGMKFSDDHRKNLSIAHKGQRPACPYESGHIPWNKGKKYSQVDMDKLSSLFKERMRGRKGEDHPMWGKHHTRETKEKLRIAKSGNKSNLWRGGVSPQNIKRFSNYGWRDLTEKIRRRDNYTCQQCFQYPAYDVHHIIPFRMCKKNDRNNLITLCKSCHKKLELAIQ